MVMDIFETVGYGVNSSRNPCSTTSTNVSTVCDVNALTIGLHNKINHVVGDSK